MQAERDGAGAPSPDRERPLLTRRGAIINIAGFAVGLALLGWVVAGALEGGDFGRVLRASPWPLALLLSSTVVSALASGTTFWVTVRPFKALGFLDLQRLNLVANMLNYLPLRLGAILRIVYHARVDGLSLMQIGAWFTMIFYVLGLGVGSCALATLVRPAIDLWWGALVAGQMALGGVLTIALVGQPLVARYGQGIDRLLGNHATLWTAMALRLIEIAAYCGRMAAALMIVEIALPFGDVVILSLVALVASLVPFGRLGFREFCVALAASRLSAAGAAADVPWEQLALVESAGEAIIYVPGGVMALFWVAKKMRRATLPS